MQCVFCGKQIESVEKAVEQDWYPDFWDCERHYQGPVCPQCVEEHLLTADDGEYALKPGHAVPAEASQIPAIDRPPPEPTLKMRPKFSLGQIVATPAALDAIAAAGQTPDFFLAKHVHGDWGEVDDGDKRANDQALVDGSRLLSAYRTLKNERIWIITEATDDDGNRAATTILLPSEY